MAQIQEWLEEYPNDKSRLIAQKACTQFDPMLVMKDRQKTYAHFFNTKVGRILHALRNGSMISLVQDTGENCVIVHRAC